MAIDAGDTLVRALQEHNPWWEQGAAAFSLPARQKSDFYQLAQPDEDSSQFEDQQLFALVGRQGVGKTTLLKQFIHRRIDEGDAPEQFLYLPFDADPLYQLQSDEQLRQAVRYYDSRVLTSDLADEPHFILLDDVHQIEHPNKPTIEGWVKPVLDLVEGEGHRHFVLTASAHVQVERELEAKNVPAKEYQIQPILPEKFRDYIFTLHSDLEAGETRVSPTPLRQGENSVPAAVRKGAVGPLVEELQHKYSKVADYAREIQSQVVDYLALGGVISYDMDGAVESAIDVPATQYQQLRQEVRNALYQEIPGFESIQTIADLERLCALAARNRAREPIRYQELVELFDVDRRTIADSYLPALADLYLLTGVTEYDNSRPRAVRLYLRDTGLATALADGDATTILNDFDREAELARVAAFDHTMRFSYGISAAQGSDETPSVQYWQGKQGEVDFVFTVNGTPVPVGLAYQPRDREGKVAAVREFKSHYETPLGLVLAGDTVRSSAPVENLGDGIIQLPYWLYLYIC